MEGVSTQLGGERPVRSRCCSAVKIANIPDKICCSASLFPLPLQSINELVQRARSVDGHFFFFGGTLAPLRRALDSPIAMACLRLFTFLPDRPLFSFPRFRSRIAVFTSADAFFPYFAMLPPCIE